MPSLPASRVEVFDVLVPANTAKAAAFETATAWQPGELSGLRIFIPDGHNGLTGVRVALAHSPVIPRTEGAWITGNDESIDFELVGYPNTGAWSVFTYNTDAFPHTFHLIFRVTDFRYLGGGDLPAPTLTPALS